MLAAYIVIGVAVGAAIIAFAAWVLYTLRRKDADDLARYLRGGDCRWTAITAASDGSSNAPEAIHYTHSGPDAKGIEMRVYDFSRFPGHEGDDEDGICLSIIDHNNLNGMVLNRFDRELDALQFGDRLWNETFLEDPEVMARVIAEKRAAWDQEQKLVIMAHYGHFF